RRASAAKADRSSTASSAERSRRCSRISSRMPSSRPSRSTSCENSWTKRRSDPVTTDTLDVLLSVLWQVTWQAGLLAFAVMLITRTFRRRLSPQATQLLWLLVFVRLAMPVLPASALSVFGLLRQESPPVVQITVSERVPAIPFTEDAIPEANVRAP